MRDLVSKHEVEVQQDGSAEESSCPPAWSSEVNPWKPRLGAGEHWRHGVVLRPPCVHCDHRPTRKNKLWDTLFIFCASVSTLKIPYTTSRCPYFLVAEVGLMNSTQVSDCKPQTCRQNSYLPFKSSLLLPCLPMLPSVSSLVRQGRTEFFSILTLTQW